MFLSPLAVQSLLSIAMRGLALVSKFLLILSMAKFLSPSDLGEYGLVASSISYLIYFLGCDFYSYATREMLAVPEEKWGGILRDQIILYSITYLLFLPFALFLFKFNLLAWKFMGVFYLLLIFEHISQEFYRILVAVGKPLQASAVLFFRTGIWCYAIIALFFLKITDYSILTVLHAWMWADLVAVLLSLYFMRRIYWHKSIMVEKINWTWMLKGIRVSAGLLIGTLALRGIITFDRYILAFYGNKEIVGVYTFYMGISNAVTAFIDAAVFVFFYPKLILSFGKGDITGYTLQFKKTTLIVLCVLAFAIILAGSLIFPLIYLIDKPIYMQYIFSYFVVLASAAVFILGMLPHYGLYAIRADKSIIYSHLFSLIIFLSLAFLLTPLYGISGMSVALLSAYLISGIVKFILYKKSIKSAVFTS